MLIQAGILKYISLITIMVLRKARCKRITLHSANPCPYPFRLILTESRNSRPQIQENGQEHLLVNVYAQAYRAQVIVYDICTCTCIDKMRFQTWCIIMSYPQNAMS